jgi:hypothetical protein
MLTDEEKRVLAEKRMGTLAKAWLNILINGGTDGEAAL